MTTAKGILGSATFDGRVLTVQKWSGGSTRVPLQSVQALALVPCGPISMFGPVGARALVVTVAGAPERKVGRGMAPYGSRAVLARDPYAVVYRTRAQPSFEALVREVESARSAAPNLS